MAAILKIYFALCLLNQNANWLEDWKLDRKYESRQLVENPCGWLGGAKVSYIFCHSGRPADIGL